MTPAGRDRQLEQWLEAQGGRTGAAPSGGACLDAERAAAWLDGQLAPVELRTAQAHVAGCGQCQLLLQTLMEAELAAGSAPASTPGAGPGRSSAGEHPTAAWWQGWLSWGAPLGAAAAAVLAVGLWLRVPPPPPAGAPASQSAVDALVRTEPPQPPVPPLQGAGSGTQPQARTDNTVPAAPASAPPAEPDARRAPAPSPAMMAKAAAAGQAGAAEVPPPPAENRVIGGVTGGIVGGFAASADRPAPPPPPPAAAPAAQASTAVAGAALRERASDASAAARVEVRAAAGGERWRATGSRIERSRDEGTTWTDVSAPAGITLLGASAPSAGTCWFVGRGGAVLVFTELQGLTRVAFPQGVDLVSVTATNAREARVDTSDGRRFLTRDAGLTWQLER